MTKKDRLVKIEEVMLRLRLQHGPNVQKPLNVDTDSKKGYKSRTATQFCSDPIEEWTCPQCMKEYNGYGRSVVYPCWVCRDKRSLSSFGLMRQENLSAPRFSRSFSEQEVFEDWDYKLRQKESADRLVGQLKETDKKLKALRRSGGASVAQIEILIAKRKRLRADHEMNIRKRSWFPDYDPNNG